MKRPREPMPRVMWSDHTDLYLNRPIERVLEAMLASIRSRTLTNRPFNMMLSGESGLGKTTILEIFTAYLRKEYPQEGGAFPYIHIVVHAPVTTRHLAGQMLAALGDERFAMKGHAPEQTERLVKLIAIRKPVAIIIDEGGDLGTGPTDAGAKKAGQWLKALIVRLGVPVIIAGTPPVLQLLKTESQFSGRFLQKAVLPKLAWDWATPDTGFRHWLIWRVERSNVPGVELFLCEPTAARLYLASQGRIGRASDLISYVDMLFESGQIRALKPALIAPALSSAVDMTICATNPFGSALNDERAVAMAVELARAGGR